MPKDEQAINKQACRLVHHIGTCPYDQFDNKYGVPCENNPDACIYQMEELLDCVGKDEGRRFVLRLIKHKLWVVGAMASAWMGLFGVIATKFSIAAIITFAVVQIVFVEGE